MAKPIFNIRLLKQGDKCVFDEIYHYYYKRVAQFATSLTKVESDAMDIVQEVFIKLWEKRETISESDGVEALIFSITKNSVLSLFRRRSTEKKYIAYLETVSDQYENDTEDEANYKLLKTELDNITNQLPSKCQKVFRLSRESGLSNKEIAIKLDISEKTVEGHITKALAYIKEHIKDLGIFGTLIFYLHF